MRMTLRSKLAERSNARRSPGIVLPAVKTQMLKEYGTGNNRAWDFVHPSELSHQDRFCPRAVYMRITEGPLPPGKFDFVRENIFEEGNQIHLKWQARLRRAVPLWGDWKCLACGDVERNRLEPPVITPMGDSDHRHVWEYAEVSLDARETHLLAGHADGAFGNTMVEIKSVGAGTVRIEAPALYRRYLRRDGQVDLQGLWEAIDRPFTTHLHQGDIYLWLARHQGLPFEQMSYIYESKWNQRVCEYVIPYDEARSLALVDQAQQVMYAVQRKEQPVCRHPGACAECKLYDARRVSRSLEGVTKDQGREGAMRS